MEEVPPKTCLTARELLKACLMEETLLKIRLTEEVPLKTRLMEEVPLKTRLTEEGPLMLCQMRCPTGLQESELQDWHRCRPNLR